MNKLISFRRDAEKGIGARVLDVYKTDSSLVFVTIKGVYPSVSTDVIEIPISIARGLYHFMDDEYELLFRGHKNG